MTTPSSSFRDYQKHILGELQSFTPKQVLAFSIWCAFRLANSVELGAHLPESDINLLHDILAEAWSWVGDRPRPKAERVSDLRNRLLCIGPSDPELAIELDPRVIETLSCVEIALVCYLTESIVDARNATQCLINVIDYETDNNLPLETTFEFPPLRAEYERQLKMIDYLRTATLGRTSLEQLRSFERFFR